MRPLVLGSSSPYRKAVLDKLEIPFRTDTPRITETRSPGEPPGDLVQRLAEMKARDVGSRHPGALIIGSDQVASLDEKILGKPGSRENAIAQLLAASAQTVTFLTGLSLYNSETGRTQTAVEPFVVRFRQLTRTQIERYVDREQPYDCAGSFKSEGYGITLFSGLEGRDPNALMGLPLILLVDLLANEGVRLP
jgi:septum formation protein